MKGLGVLIYLVFVVSLSFGQDTDPVFNKAEDLFAKGEYQKAAELYTQVISGNANNMNAYLRRGFCQSVLKNYDEAVKDFTFVVEKHSDHPFAYLSRGSAFIKKEEFNLALADFDKVLSIDPENQEAYNNRGWAKNGLGLYKEACKDWKTSKKMGNSEAKLILKNNHCK